VRDDLLQVGGQNIQFDTFYLFMYQDSFFNPEDPEEGFLRSDILLKVIQSVDLMFDLSKLRRHLNRSSAVIQRKTRRKHAQRKLT
jgi:hypothetical protein